MKTVSTKIFIKFLSNLSKVGRRSDFFGNFTICLRSVYTCDIVHISYSKDGGDDMSTLSKLLVGIDVNNPDPDVFQFACWYLDSYDATMVLAAFITIDINIMSDSYFQAELDFVDSIIKEEETKIRKYFSSLIDQHGGAVEIETLISVNDPVVGLSETAEKKLKPLRSSYHMILIGKVSY